MKIAGLALAAMALLMAGACSSTRRADGTTVSETVEINVRTEPDGARCTLTRGGKVIASVAATPEKVTIERGIRAIVVSCEREGHIPGAEIMQSTYVGGPGTRVQQYDYSVAGSIGYGLASALAAGVRAGSPANYEYASFVTVAVPSNTFPDAAARDARYAELRQALEERNKRKLSEVQTNCGDNADLCRTAKRDAEKENADELAKLDGFRQQAVIEPPKPATKPTPVAAKKAGAQDLTLYRRTAGGDIMAASFQEVAMKLILIAAMGCLIAAPVLAQAPMQNKPKANATTPTVKSEMSEEEQMRLQMQQDKRKKAMETQSNIQKKNSETNSNIIQNMK